MKTKHLFFATALVASLAACTNDDFSFDKQQNVANDGRPTVSDVKLNFVGDNADTRLAFNGEDGYVWEANDTIGALLMDKVKTVDASKTWLEKYDLTEFIHTSYPFTYSPADETWGCNTKMLEGNYFFAFPWESYDGNRKVSHSLTNQQQNGVKGSVVAESYAKNQFFIGYSQIKAGTEAKDALTDVEMTSILGAIQLRIVNTGTQTYHINKIVLEGTGLSSTLTFNPTDAAYGNAGKWSLDSDKKSFNYANYTGNQDDLVTTGGSEYVYTIEAGDKYDRMAALREVVEKADNETFAQLIINGTEAERALISTKVDEKAVAYALIMANAHKPAFGNLKLDIYTDEGMVQDIDLTTINETKGDYMAITDSKVEEIAPNVSNTIKVQIDDNSFVVPQTMQVYNNEDLLQFIKWNGKVTGTRACKATIMKPTVTLTKEMVELLKASKNVTLTINGSETLAIAEDVPADFLDYRESEKEGKLVLSTDIKVLGTVDITAKSELNGDITVAEGATMNINENNKAFTFDVTNEGTLNVAKDIVVENGTITNEGEMTIAEEADVKAEVVNNGTLNQNGYMSDLTNNAEVVMGEGAIIAGGSNSAEAVIRTAKDAQVSITNSGEIIYVDGAIISATGTIAFEASGVSIDDKTLKDTGVNKLILKKGITKITADVSFAEVVAEDGASLNVSKDKTLSVSGTFTVEEGCKATVQGNVKVKDVVVEKDATLDNATGAVVTVSGSFTNNGTVANNGKVILPKDGTVEGEGTWKYNKVENAKDPVVVETKQSTMDAAVNAWAAAWDGWNNKGDNSSVENFYGYTPYDVDKFIDTMNAWSGAGASAEEKAAAGNLAKLWLTKDATSDTFDEVLKKADGTAVAEFTTAVDAVLAAKVAALKKVIVDAKGGLTNVTLTADADINEDKTTAYDKFRLFVANPNNVTNIPAEGKVLVAATAWYLTETEIDDLLSKSAKATDAYAYNWKGSKLDKMMSFIVKTKISEWNTFFGGDGAALSLSAVTSNTTLDAWMKAAYKANLGTSGLAGDVKALLEDYYDVYGDWKYDDTQIAKYNHQ